MSTYASEKPIAAGDVDATPHRAKRLHFPVTPPQVFALASLLLIVAVGVATSITQSSFYRDVIIRRDSAIIQDMVRAMIAEQESEGALTSADLAEYGTPAAKEHLNHSFRALKNVSGEARIKVFNASGQIAWSDEPRLIGTSFTRNGADLARALHGEVRAVFNPKEWVNIPFDALPDKPLIEFYVPFSLADRNAGNAVSGVLSLYRSPDDLLQAIAKGRVLLWLVTGIGGLILFVSLYSLFRTVYYGKRRVESQFARLTTEHARIMQLEKLSAMGQMVSEIAHQLNNPLVGVINLTQLAERDLDNRERVKELLAEVRKAGGECRDFVQRMLRLSKVNHSKPHTTDMNALVKETIAFFQQSLGGKPVITFRGPPQNVMANVDPVLIRNALFNVVHNAALADPKGPVSISLASCERDGVPGWNIVVSDCGPGLTPDALSKLFTPFFTTRPGGTGLGLSIAQHIVAQHGGSITARNNADGGACFTVWLPMTR